MITEYIYTHSLEIFGVVTGLMYIWLEINQRNAMWIVGFMSTGVYVFVFASSKLYAETCLNIYYCLVSIYGYWNWRKSKPSTLSAEPFIYPILRLKTGIILTVLSLSLFLLFAQVLKKYTDTDIPHQDALITSLSIVGTWMLAKKYVQHWYIWIAVNGFSVYVFCWKGLFPTAILFLIYFILSWYGFWKWNKDTINPVSETMNDNKI
jgi:nicotinamide mononucleotide transporter